jgi:hypothetical protein
MPVAWLKPQPYFAAHPSELLESGETVRRGWIVNLPRLRDRLERGCAKQGGGVIVIYFCGDTHGCFDHVIDVVGQDRPAAVVFLGDLQAQRPLEIELASILDMTEVWYIHGNHDTDSEADYDNLFGSALADRNLHGRGGDRRAADCWPGGIFRGQVGHRLVSGCMSGPGTRRAMRQGQPLARWPAAQTPQLDLPR